MQSRIIAARCRRSRAGSRSGARRSTANSTRPPKTIRRKVTRTEPATGWSNMASAWQRSWQTNDIGGSEAFEPWLGGDRQRAGSVAKARNPLQGGFLKSVCREVPRAALAAAGVRVYRLRMNRCVQAYRSWECIQTRSDVLTECVFRTDQAGALANSVKPTIPRAASRRGRIAQGMR